MKEGTENKGAIESVVRVIRKTVSFFSRRKHCGRPLKACLAFDYRATAADTTQLETEDAQRMGYDRRG